MPLADPAGRIRVGILASPADVNEPPTPTPSAAGAHRRARGRRAAAVLAVTGRRVRARPGRALLVSAGVTVAVAFLAGVAGGSAVSEDLALRHALGTLPPAQRALRVAWSGQVAVGGYAGLDRSAQRAVGSLTNEPVARSIEYADLNLGSGLIKLAAVGGLKSYVHLRSGRLPRACTPARCEVVQVGGSPVGRIDKFGVHLSVVGTGTLTSLVPFGADGLETQSTAGGARPEPILLSGSVRGLGALPPLHLFSRSYGWTAALDPGSEHVWDVNHLLAAEGRATGQLTADNGQFALTAPDDALTSARAAAETASHRVLLVGGAAAVLLLAFAGLTAGAMRRDVQAELRRLGQRGATIWQQAGFVLAEAFSAVLPGVLAGLVLGVGAVTVIARRSGVPAAEALSHGLATPASIALVAAGAIGALAVVALALRKPPAGRPRGVRPVDVAAVGAVVALALLLADGSSNGSALSAGPAVTLAATPLLASFAFAVLLGRLLEPAIRAGLRASRNAPVTLRLALLALHRSPTRAAGVAGFLAVSVGLATFALSYRATLDRSNAERAAYSVPLDYTLNEGAALVAPSEAGSLAQYRALAPGVGAWPILRQVAETAGSGGTPATPTVLGVPWDALPLLHGWRGDFSSKSTAQIARLLRPRERVALAGAAIPRTATRLELPARISGNGQQLVLVIHTPSDDAVQLNLPLPPPGRQRVLSVAAPPAVRGGRVTAILVQLPSAEQKSAAHQGAEGRNVVRGFAGSIQLGALTAVTPAGRVRMSTLQSWGGHGGVTTARGGGPVALRYVIDTSEQAQLRPQQPFDTRRLPVVASPDVAASAGPDGALELSFEGQVVHARLVGVANRFPTTQDSDNSFVLADEGSLASAIGADDLPSAIPDELWLSTPPASRARVGTALRHPPYSSLDIASRAAIHADLESDPIARGIVSSLVAAAIAALALALLGVALATLGFLRDESDSLFDLESQGAGPRALRACVRWRALGLAGLGVLAGVVLGIGLAIATGRLLALDATLAVPDPPLLRITPWLTIGVCAAGLTLLAALLVEAALHVAYRRGAAGRGTTGEVWAE
jgi:hypothetical protein